MLILTRRPNEALTIGKDVIVTILGISGNRVRVGINAPKSVAVHREEIREHIPCEQHPFTPGYMRVGRPTR